MLNNNSFKISKGHNLLLDGNPEKNIITDKSVSKIVFNPSSIKGIKPKISVKEDDSVKVGSKLFFDKNNPEVPFVSTCSGKILKVVYGERRSLDSIIIENDGRFESGKLDFDINRNSLIKSGLWTFLRKRPFSVIPNSNENPNSIFISALSTQPFGLDFEFILKDSDNYLQQGIDILKKIFNCEIYFTSTSDSFFKGLSNVSHYSFNKLHPAGNVGIQMHHINPIKDAGDSKWYLSLQDLNRIGEYFQNKEYPSYKHVVVAGNGFSKPSYYKQLIGTPISHYIKDNSNDGVQIISGDVLSGTATVSDNSLRYYDEILSVIKVNNKRDFLGWLMPGLKKYTVSNVFLSKLIKNKSSELDLRLNGSVRSIIHMGVWDKLLPMNIMPEFLIKSILAEDIDMMEKLGIYECSPEDFALCSFACQSKVEVSSIIEDGLNLMKDEA